MPTFPPDGPATVPAVKSRLRLTDTEDDTDLDLIVKAVNRKVTTWPAAAPAGQVDPVTGVPTYPDWTSADLAHIVLGAVMLAARIFRRRNTPDGVQAFGNLGAVYVQRNDPDIALLLDLGAAQKPAIG